MGHVRLPFGFALATLGVLIVGAAAPFDVWYHAVFGKDVLIWSPPHTLAHIGGMVAASGLLFAAAAQYGRGVLKRRWLWTVALLLSAVHFIHIPHYVLAHYIMTPATRTPEFYPLLVAIMFPMVLVAPSRAAGPPTPVFAVHALAIAGTCAVAGRAAARAWPAAVAGLAFALSFVGTEAVWMANAVGQPWPREVATPALPTTLVAGALSGLVGWVWGGFLRASRVEGGAAEVFDSRARVVPSSRRSRGAAARRVQRGHHRRDPAPCRSGMVRA